MKNSSRLKDEVDDLFKLPLADFTEARNALAKRLKQSGRADDANLVKTLVKPSISAWAVNQLYWNHRSAFERLLAAGQRFHKAQTSGASGKIADLRGALEARREALTHLSELAESLLSEAGHNASPETICRITTTLEAVSARASSDDGPTLGRLSQDVDPPGFELLAAFIPAGGTMKGSAAPRRTPSTASAAVSQPTAARERETKRKLEQTRQVRIAAAKLSLQAAKKSLLAARNRVQSLESAHKRANTEAKEAEKRKREAEAHLKRANAASEEAARRAKNIADDVEEAAKAVEEARRAVERESKELESLFSEAL